MDSAGTATKWLLMLIPLMLIGCILGLVLLLDSSKPAAASCNPTGPAAKVDPASLPKGSVAGFSKDQLKVAADIMLAAEDMNLTRRDQQIGVMTAIGESTLASLDYGDAAGPDSRGPFQQRDSWGSEADRKDPYKSATMFFDAMKKVANRDSLEPTIVAHKTQANRDPFHYEPHWATAGKIVDALSGIKATEETSTQGTGASQAESNYDLGKVQPQTAALANTLGPKFNIETIGGYRASDPFPDHPSGLAADLMIPPGDKATGDKLAAYAKENADELGIDYIIWYQRTWSVDRDSEGWRDMAPRGSKTADHKDHVHITMKADAEPVAADGCTTGTSGAKATKDGWTEPAAGPVTSPFGNRAAPTAGASSHHKGIDYGPGCGEPIYATNSGEVIDAGPATGFGQWIQIDHGEGIVSTYGHMYADGLHVQVGDTVKSGQRIADVGSGGTSTGCHLHFEVTQDGQKIDPLGFLRTQGLDIASPQA